MATKNDATEEQQDNNQEQQAPATAVINEPITTAKKRIFKADDCMFIREIGTRRAYNVDDAKARNYGKYYRTFNIEGRSFTVIESDKFCKDFDKENIEELHLTESELSDKGWDFVAHISISQVDKRAETLHKREGFTFAKLQREKLTSPEDFL